MNNNVIKKVISAFSALLIIVCSASSALYVFAYNKSESSYHAGYKLESDTINPKPGDTITVTVSAKSDYPVIILDSVIVYDSEYYSIVGNATDAVKKLCNYSVKMSAVTKSVSAMYHQSYSTKMTEKYKLVFVTMQWLSSLGEQVGDTPTDTLKEYTKIYSFKLKVKKDAPKDNNGLIWMDPVYVSSATSNLRSETRVCRGGSYLKDGVIAPSGQSIDLSEAKLFGGNDTVMPADFSINVKYKNQTDLKSTMFSKGLNGKKYAWTTSDDSVLSVSDGMITGIKRGSAYVSAVSSDYSSRFNCKINVDYSFSQWLIIIFLFGWIWY